MKTLQVTSKIYDKKTLEYVCKHAEFPISDKLAEMIRNEYREAGERLGHCPVTISGHGHKDFPGHLETPVANKERFYIDSQFHIYDENDELFFGFEGM